MGLEFPKLGVHYFGVLIIRIPVFRVISILGSPIFGNSQIGFQAIQELRTPCLRSPTEMTFT